MAANVFKDEVLNVTFQEKNISEVLDMTIDEAIMFFDKTKQNTIIKRLLTKLQPLQDVGLGYLKMGQPSNTLSGGEAQRIKLASFLTIGDKNNHSLFIFDEPTIGLHMYDISKLLDSLNALIENGHTVLIIEHNSEIIKSADWIIDLGPEGGDKGGEIVFEGTPEELINSKISYTGKYLKSKF